MHQTRQENSNLVCNNREYKNYTSIERSVLILLSVPPEGVDDRKTWAKAVVNQHRCWSNSSFIRGLASTRSESEKEALVDEMYSRLEEEIVAQDPKVFKNWYLLGYVFARKV